MTDLAEAQARLASAIDAVEKAGRDRDFAALRAAYDDRLTAQRDVGRLSGRQYAERIDLGFRVDAGAPLPHVISDARNTIVIFYRHQPNPAWDGSTATIVDPRDPAPASLGLVHFTGVYLTKFGGLNDEAIAGHPLHGHGLERYEAHVVRNSEWIAEAEQANSVHPNHRPGWSEQYEHFVICFHDEMLECIAEAWQADVLDATVSGALRLAADRIVGS
jgi:hypothetical protein